MRLTGDHKRGVYVVRSPDMPGVVAVGDTRCQAERYFRLALATLTTGERDRRQTNKDAVTPSRICAPAPALVDASGRPLLLPMS